MTNESADLWPEESELAELADRISKRLGGEIRRLQTRVASRAAQMAGETRGKITAELIGPDAERNRELYEQANEISQERADEIVRVQALLPSRDEGRSSDGQYRYREFLDASVKHLQDMASCVAGEYIPMRANGESRAGEALDKLQQVSELLDDARKAEEAASETWS